jgi:hypothetical protein
LRIQSSGQPSGYQAEYPNAKHALEKRREWFDRLNKKDGKLNNSFSPSVGGDPSSLSFENWKELMPLAGTACFPLPQLISKLQTQEWADVYGILNDMQRAHLKDFCRAMQKVLEKTLVFQLMDQSIVNNPDEYIRFFTRIGQGGSRLSEDELMAKASRSICAIRRIPTMSTPPRCISPLRCR